MQNLERVALIGLGAVGVTYAKDLLALLGPDRFKVIVSPERKARYERHGIFLNGEKIPFSYVTPGAKEPPFDFVLVSVKAPALSAAIAETRPFVGQNTILLPILNGLSAEEALGRALGEEKLLYGFTAIGSRREGNNFICRLPGKILFGEKEGIVSERLLAVKALFDRAGILSEIPEDILREKWWKFMFNIGVNTFSAILSFRLGVFLSVPEAKELMLAAQREILSLSDAAGAGLNEGDLQRILDSFATFSPDGEPSMWQDIKYKRKTENEALSGEAVRLGEKYGVPTPINSFLYNLIKTLEFMYKGEEK